ncbi:hypothetical protein AAHC03_020818 [Spirometra sp. Aus1]
MLRQASARASSGSITGFNGERRRSVLPTQSQFKSCVQSDARADEEEATLLPATLRRASLAAHNLRRISSVFKKEGPREFLRAALGDPNREYYKKLAGENEELTTEWKRLKGYLKTLADDYESCKAVDPLRRYRLLRAMVKRIVLHMQITDPLPSVQAVLPGGDQIICGSVLRSSVRMQEIKQKHQKMCNSFNTEELARETEKMREKNAELQDKIEILIGAIKELSDRFELLKHVPIYKRYHLLKDAVKTLIRSSADCE